MRALEELRRGRQFAVRRRARPGDDAARRLAGRCRPRCRRARRQDPLQRPAGRPGRHRRVAHRALPVRRRPSRRRRPPRTPQGWLELRGITRNNLRELDARFPLGVMTAVIGVSGSGKSSLVSQALVELACRHLGHEPEEADAEPDTAEPTIAEETQGRIAAGMERIARLVRVDQKPIGRTPRSNLATYTGLFDAVRKLFASTPMARSRRYDPGRFSFNVAKGRCETCEGEGFVSVELHFMPSVYAPCPDLPRRPLQREDARGSLAGPEHRRGPAADGRRRPRPVRRRAGDRQAACCCCRPSASATCAWASPRPSCRAARRSGSSSRPSCSGRSGAARSMCSTSRRPAFIPPTWIG